eukprot:10848529-Prorocentrum_lima.AAC.1
MVKVHVGGWTLISELCRPCTTMYYESILEVVANQDPGKSRFSLLSLKPNDGGPCEPWAVRANHGHSHPMPWPS